MMSIHDTIDRNKVRACKGCDRCADVCPVRDVDPRFSPAGLVSSVLDTGGPAGRDATLWECTLCGACRTRCPEPGVDFAGFVLDLRAARFRGIGAHAPAHHGVFQLLASPPAPGEVTPDRLFWVPKDRPACDAGSILLAGCVPFLDRYFGGDLGYNPGAAAAGALSLLDACGVRPGVKAEEPCCGAELLLVGDREGAARQARRLKAFAEKFRPSRFVAVSERCAWAIEAGAKRAGIEIGVPVESALEVLAERCEALEFEERKVKAALVTWPAGERIDDAARRVLARVPEIEVLRIDPPLSSGLQGFHHCGRTSRGIQGRSLERAAAAGADLVLAVEATDTVHFRCAARPAAWQGGGVPVRDLFEFLAEALRGVGEGEKEKGFSRW